MVCLTSNYDLDLYASASASVCILRIMSTNAYFQTIKPVLREEHPYRIFKLLLSSRGYLVIQEKCLHHNCHKDMLLVYSINGERIHELCLYESINAMFFDSTHYFIVLFSM